MCQVRPTLIVVCLCLTSGLLAQTPGPFHTIYGRVSLPDGSAASRVTVNISGQSGFSRQVFTDDAGQYEIQGVPRGRYSLTAINPASPEQYSDRSDLELSRLTPARVALNIYLRAGAKFEPARKGTASAVSVAEVGQHVPKAAQKEFEKAVRLGKNQQLDKALQSFNRSIELFPEYFQAITQRGHLRITMRMFAEAEKYFARALELNSGYEPALRGAGICKLRQDKYTDAIKDLEQAVSTEPHDAAAHLFLGFTYASVDRHEDARAALQKALNLDPAGSVRAHVYLANLAMKEDRTEEAVAELEKYLAAVPNAPDAEKLRALLSRLKAQRE